MKRLSKTEQFNVRLSPDQQARVERALRIVSQEAGEMIAASTLFRRCAMEGIDAIIAKASLATEQDRRQGERRQVA